MAALDLEIKAQKRKVEDIKEEMRKMKKKIGAMHEIIMAITLIMAVDSNKLTKVKGESLSEEAKKNMREELKKVKKTMMPKKKKEKERKKIMHKYTCACSSVYRFWPGCPVHGDYA